MRLTKAGISGYRIKVRDDWETASGAIEQTKKVIIKKCGISLPKVRDDLCRYSLDPASERGMTRQALQGIGEDIKKSRKVVFF